MTSRIKSSISIPIWLITILLSVFTGVSGFTINEIRTKERMKSNIEANEKAIQEFNDELNKKANAEKVDMIYTIVLNIDSKVDDILKENNNGTQHR